MHRWNQFLFMNQELTKALITRTPLIEENMKDIRAGNLFACKAKETILLRNSENQKLFLE